MTASGLCITTDGGAPAQGGSLRLGGCGFDLDNSYAPTADVGAGAAGEPAEHTHGTWHQLVNYEQFGRCLDVSFFDPHHPYMVAWPCKQGAGYVGWNQKWYVPSSTEPGPIRTYYPGGEFGSAGFYCLRPPLALGGYPIFDPCTGSDPTWTFVRDTHDDWPSDYVIKDEQGRCLAAKSKSLGDFMPHSTDVSKVAVVACGDDPLQKWNAPPRPVPPALSDTAED